MRNFFDAAFHQHAGRRPKKTSARPRRVAARALAIGSARTLVDLPPGKLARGRFLELAGARGGASDFRVYTARGARVSLPAKFIVDPDADVRLVVVLASASVRVGRELVLLHAVDPRDDLDFAPGERAVIYLDAPPETSKLRGHDGAPLDVFVAGGVRAPVRLAATKLPGWIGESARRWGVCGPQQTPVGPPRPGSLGFEMNDERARAATTRAVKALCENFGMSPAQVEALCALDEPALAALAHFEELSEGCFGAYFAALRRALERCAWNKASRDIFFWTAAPLGGAFGVLDEELLGGRRQVIAEFRNEVAELERIESLPGSRSAWVERRETEFRQPGLVATVWRLETRTRRELSLVHARAKVVCEAARGVMRNASFIKTLFELLYLPSAFGAHLISRSLRYARANCRRRFSRAARTSSSSLALMSARISAMGANQSVALSAENSCCRSYVNFSKVRYSSSAR